MIDTMALRNQAWDLMNPEDGRSTALVELVEDLCAYIDRNPVQIVNETDARRALVASATGHMK